MANFFTNCRNSDGMGSNGSSRLAETCATRDDSPSLELGRGKQVHAMRTVSTDLRVATLLHESETTVELVTVSSILDCESGCTIKRASDTGTGRLLVVRKERRGVVQQDTRQLAVVRQQLQAKDNDNDTLKEVPHLSNEGLA